MAKAKKGGSGGAKAAPTADKLKAARRAGFKSKKPKKPKSKTETALLNYISRYNAWVDGVNAGAAQDVKNKAAEANRKKLIAVVSGL